MCTEGRGVAPAGRSPAGVRAGADRQEAFSQPAELSGRMSLGWGIVEQGNLGELLGIRAIAKKACHAVGSHACHVRTLSAAVRAAMHAPAMPWEPHVRTLSAAVHAAMHAQLVQLVQVMNVFRCAHMQCPSPLSQDLLSASHLACVRRWARVQRGGCTRKCPGSRVDSCKSSACPAAASTTGASASPSACAVSPTATTYGRPSQGFQGPGAQRTRGQSGTNASGSWCPC